MAAGARLCFWCGGPPARGKRDHVFQRGLFLPALTNPLTVPACELHNEAFSDHDQYFRDSIVSGSWRHPEARRIWDEKTRQQFRESPKYAAMTLRQVSQHDVRTPVGLHRGPLLLSFPNKARIELVFRKIIRGLYCHHFDERRSLGPIELKLWQISPLSPLPPDEIRNALLLFPMQSLGHVQYKFITEPDLDPALGYEALAMASFFDRRIGFVFAAATSEKDDRLSIGARPRLWIPDRRPARRLPRTLVLP